MAKRSKVKIESDAATTRVYLDGKDITNFVQQITFEAGTGGKPRMLIEYDCFEQLTIDGEADIVHLCPKGGRK